MDVGVKARRWQTELSQPECVRRFIFIGAKTRHRLVEMDERGGVDRLIQFQHDGRQWQTGVQQQHGGAVGGPIPQQQAQRLRHPHLPVKRGAQPLDG